jgi:hypothetical protein
MKLDVEIGGRLRKLEVGAPDGVWQGELDGKIFSANAKEVGDGTYSILIGRRAYLVHVEPQRQGLMALSGRWRVCGERSRSAAVAARPSRLTLRGGA